jgi:hypothetical protein
VPQLRALVHCLDHHEAELDHDSAACPIYRIKLLDLITQLRAALDQAGLDSPTLRQLDQRQIKP